MHFHFHRCVYSEELCLDLHGFLSSLTLETHIPDFLLGNVKLIFFIIVSEETAFISLKQLQMFVLDSHSHSQSLLQTVVICDLLRGVNSYRGIRLLGAFFFSFGFFYTYIKKKKEKKGTAVIQSLFSDFAASVTRVASPFPSIVTSGDSGPGSLAPTAL